jgi:DNA processing protein
MGAVAGRPRVDGAGAVHSPEARRIARGDADYPAGLRDLRDAPAALQVRGALPPWGRSVAVVGSRAATPYGLAFARRLAGDLAAAGVPVVSGLARGIDAAAHEGALAAGGPTVAVLPGGLDAITPPEHTGLAERVAGRGALLSEWEGARPANRGMFVRRNRLIAALARVVVVVEAAERSGALSTASAARRLGRALLAVPGDIDRPTSRGANALLRAGARACLDAGDVLAALPATTTGGAPAPADVGEVTPAGRLLAILEAGPLDAGSLAARAGLPPGAALAALLALEWAGAVERLPGPRWRRSAR